MDSCSSSDDGSDIEEVTDFLDSEPAPDTAGMPQAASALPPIPSPAAAGRELSHDDDSNSSDSDGSSDLGDVEDFLESIGDEPSGSGVSAGGATEPAGAKTGGGSDDSDSDSDSEAEEIVDLDDDEAFGADDSAADAAAASSASSTGSSNAALSGTGSSGASQLNVLGTEHVDWFAVMQTAFDAAKLSAEQTGRFVGAMTAKDYDDGDAIVVQGDIGDAFYIIESGVVAIEEAKAGEDEPRVLAKLYPGHHFGELSVLSKQPRVASVIARGGRVRCHEMTKSSFDSFSEADTRCFTLVIESLVAETKRKRTNRSKVKASAHTEQLRFVEQQRRDFKLRETVTATRRSGDRKEMINEFEVFRKLGSGSFGVVKMAKSTVTGEIVALKIINKTKLRKRRLGITDEELMREVDVMRRLRNEHVVAMREAINDASHDLLIFVEEFMSMGPVMEEAEVCEPLDQSLARVYFRSVLRGLEYLHFQRVVHRDIKPANILVNEKAEAKLADFGVAAVLPDDTQTLRDVQGTPAFMAPELFNDDPVYDGFAVDIWALGATLYNLVTGRPPFLASNEFELAQKLRTEAPTIPRGINPHLKHLIMSMLERDVSKRATISALMKHDWVTIEGTDPLPPIKYVRIVPAKAAPALRKLQATARAVGSAASSVRKLRPKTDSEASAGIGETGSAPSSAASSPSGAGASNPSPTAFVDGRQASSRRPRRVRRSSLVGVPSAEAAEAAITAAFGAHQTVDAGDSSSAVSGTDSAFSQPKPPNQGSVIPVRQGIAVTGTAAGSDSGLPRRSSVPAMDSSSTPQDTADSSSSSSGTSPSSGTVRPPPTAPTRTQSSASLKSMRSVRTTMLTRQRELEDAAKKTHLQQLRRRQVQLLKGHTALAAKDRDILMEQQRIAIHASRAEAAVESIEIFRTGANANQGDEAEASASRPGMPMITTAPRPDHAPTAGSDSGDAGAAAGLVISPATDGSTAPLASPSVSQLRFMFGRQASSSGLDIAGGESPGPGFESPPAGTRIRSASGASGPQGLLGPLRSAGAGDVSLTMSQGGAVAPANLAGSADRYQGQYGNDAPGTPHSGMMSPELGAALYGVYSPGMLRSLSRRSSLRVGSSGYSTPMGSSRVGVRGMTSSRRLQSSSPVRQDSDSVGSGSFVGGLPGDTGSALSDAPPPPRHNHSSPSSARVLTSPPSSHSPGDSDGIGRLGEADLSGSGLSGNGIGSAEDDARAGVGMGRGSFLMSTSASAGAVRRPGGGRLGHLPLGASTSSETEDSGVHGSLGAAPGMSPLGVAGGGSVTRVSRRGDGPTTGRMPRTSSGRSFLSRSSSSSDVTRPSLTMRMTAQDHGLVVSTQVPNKSWLLQTWSSANPAFRRRHVPALHGTSTATSVATAAATDGSERSGITAGVEPASASSASGSASARAPIKPSDDDDEDSSFAPGLRLSVNPSLAESVTSRVTGRAAVQSRRGSDTAPTIGSVKSDGAATRSTPAHSPAPPIEDSEDASSWRPHIRRRSVDMPPLPLPVLIALAALSPVAEQAAALGGEGFAPVILPSRLSASGGAGAGSAAAGGLGSDRASIASTLASAPGNSEAAASVGSSSIVQTHSRTLRRAKDFVMVTEQIDNDDSGGLVRKAVIFHSKGNSLSLATTNREALNMRSLKRSSSRGKNALKLRVDPTVAAEAGVGDGLSAVQEAADEAETPSGPGSRKLGGGLGKSLLGSKLKDGLGKLGGTGRGDGDGSGSDDSFDGDSDGSDSSSIDSDMLDMQGAEDVTDNLDFVLGELLEAPQEDAEVAALEDILDDSGAAALAADADLGAEGVEYEDSDDDAEATGEAGSDAAAITGPVQMKCPVVLSVPVPAELPGSVRVGIRWPGIMQPTAAEDHTNTRLGLSFGVAEDQGKRDGMEDRMMALGDVNTMLGLEGEAASQAYFGVYDGHMGTSTSNMLAERLHLAVMEELGAVAESGGDPEDALKAAFVRTDREWVREQVKAQEDDQSSKFSGATAIVAMVRDEEIIIVEDEAADAAEAAKPAVAASGAGDDDTAAGASTAAAASGDEDDLGGERKNVRLLYVANAGDCRAVLCRGGWAVDLSTDHKASLESEKARVEAAGGSVHNGRVNGVIAVTRAFGDPEFKSLKDKAWWGGSFTDDVLTATPDVRSQEITPYDEFVVMACDGVWDVMTSQQAVNFVRRRLREEPDIQAATEALVAKALQLASVDNVSAIVFALNQLEAT